MTIEPTIYIEKDTWVEIIAENATVWNNGSHVILFKESSAQPTNENGAVPVYSGSAIVFQTDGTTKLWGFSKNKKTEISVNTEL